MTLARRPLGNTGLDVSCLGLGTVKFGRNMEVKYPEAFALPEDSQVDALLRRAQDLGINLLDTAPAYGSSEQRLGRLLRNRDDWVIVTKVGEEFLSGKSVYDFSAAHVQKSIERSLRYLDTDYIDLVLIHSDGNDMAILENTDCLEALEKLKDKGLIRATGMSTKTVEGGIRAAQQSDVVMVTYNPQHTDETEVIDYAAQHDKGVLIKKALNSGHMAANGKGVGRDEGDRERNAEASGKSDAASDLAFALGRKGVSSVIVGTINPQHLESNVAAAIAAGKS